jgi:hypothetical protein
VNPPHPPLISATRFRLLRKIPFGCRSPPTPAPTAPSKTRPPDGDALRPQHLKHHAQPDDPPTPNSEYHTIRESHNRSTQSPSTSDTEQSERGGNFLRWELWRNPNSNSSETGGTFKTERELPQTDLSWSPISLPHVLKKCFPHHVASPYGVKRVADKSSPYRNITPNRKLLA